MSPIGPTLPPHLTKRKREGDDGDDSASSPTPSRSSTPDGADKRRRVVGPAPPPAPLEELPPSAPQEEDDASDSSSSSDDDYGPAPPGAADTAKTYSNNSSAFPPSSSTTPPPAGKRIQRDEWMMVPPKQDDLAARMDPTKLRARGFQTGKGSRAPNHGGGDVGVWTETPEQKRKRLENEVMGVAAPAGGRGGEHKARDKEAEETARRIREHNEKTRGGSLYEQHRARVPKDVEDDPSKRAFDREKDMGGGMKIGHAKRKEMVNRAADFGSKFSGGGYL